MASASLILGMLSLIMILTGFSVIIGSVGIILALLSRVSGPLAGKAKAGLAASLIGILGGIAVLWFTFSTLFSGNLNQAMDRLDSLYQTYITEGSLDPADIQQIFSEDETQAPSADQTALALYRNNKEENC